MDSRPREMVSMLSLAEPCERSGVHCSRDLEKGGATMRHNDPQQVAQRQGWRRDDGGKKNDPNAPLR